MRRYPFLIVWLLCLVQTLFAQHATPVLVYSDSTNRIETSPYAAVLEDAKAEWTIEQVRAMPDSVFHFTRTNRLNLGNTDSRFWVRYYVDNATNEDLFFLQYNAENTHFDLFVVSEDGSMTVFPPSGTLRPFKNRAIPFPKPNFNIGKKPKIIYAATQARTTLVFTNRLGTKDAIYAFMRIDEGTGFFWLGIFLILTVYNLVIYFNNHDTPFLWYSLFQLFSIYYWLHVSGYGVQFIWQSWDFINTDANLYKILPSSAACFFSMTFLNTRNVLPRFHFYLKTLLALYGICLVLQMLGFIPLANTLFQFAVLLMYFSLWLVGCLAYLKKQRTARFFVLGWTIYVFIILFYVVGELLLPKIHDFILSYHLLIFGSISEAVLFSFALTDRIREIRQQARDTQLLLFKQTEKYEQLVQQQTLLLEEKLQLEQQNKPENKAELTELVRKMRTEQSQNRRLNVPTTEGVLWIPTQDIIRLEAMRSYCSIHLTNGKRLVASHPLSDFEKQLDTAEFMRVHKSHLVNMSQIQEYIRGEGGSLVLKDGSLVSVSRATKQALLERLGS